jgi:hypothetical protein
VKIRRRRREVVTALQLVGSELPSSGVEVAGPWLDLRDGALSDILVDYDKGAETGVELVVETATKDSDEGFRVVDEAAIERVLASLTATAAARVGTDTPASSSSGGGTAPSFQAAGTAVSSNTLALSPAWPTHVVGDIALLVVENRNWDVTLSVPAGFVEVSGSPISAGGTGLAAAVRLTMYWCRATSTAMGAPTVDFPGGHHLAQIITFRNCVAEGDPIDASAANSTTNSATVTIPAVTTTENRCLIVSTVADRLDVAVPQFDTWVNASLASFDERADSHSSAGNGGGFGMATGVLEEAGSSGVGTAVLLASSNQVKLNLALKPARAPVFVAEGTRSAAGGPHNGEEGTGPAWPTHQAGDIGIMLVEHDNEHPIVFEDAAGFVAIPGLSMNGVGSNYLTSTALSVYWCRATSGSMPQPVLVFPDPTPGAGEDHWVSKILVFRGCVGTGVPFDVIARDTAGSDIAAPSTSGSVPGASTSVDDCLVLAIATNNFDNSLNASSGWTNAALANLREVSNAVTSFGKGGAFGVAAGVKSAKGAYGTTAVTWQFATETQARATIALRSRGRGAGRRLPIRAARARLVARGVGGTPSTPSSLVVRAVIER